MTRPLVSAVIPVFNGARFLEEALRSAVQQDYRPLEIIVVDDGSTDGSAAIARSFAEVTYLRQENRGVAAARNAGVAAGRGEIIAFLDQDDRWRPGKLAAQVAYLEAHPEVGIVLARMRAFLEPGSEPPSWFRPSLLEKDVDGLTPGTYVVRRRLFESVGPFNEDFATASDSDWLLRARRAGETLPVVPEVLLDYRVHSTNQSSQATCTAELLVLIHRWVKAQKAAKDAATAPDAAKAPRDGGPRAG
jgi:glycosyltransferase involved in cell wall biosynthesis